MSFLIVLLVLGSSLIGESGATAVARANPTRTQAGTALPAPGAVIVAMRNDSITAASDFVAAAGIEPTQVYTSVINGFAATLSASDIRDLARDPNVANIIADTPVSLFAQYTPTHIKRTGISKYPAAAIDGIEQVTDVDIAFLDGGIAGSHGDLNIAGGHTCVGGDPLHDASSHGTHTAGVAAARDNDFGVVGAAPGARIWSVKVFNDAGGSSQSTILCGLDWIVSSGVGIDVLNLSIGNNSGSPAVSTCFDQVDPLHDAICSINSAGITIVVAAGNSAANASTYNYAKFPETISVAAIADYNGWPGGGAADPCGYDDGPDDTFTNFSNYGAVVDIAAPGSCILSTVPGGYEYGTGTSMAAPLVAGAVGLYLSQNPGSSPAQVRSWLLSNAASKVRSSSVGYTGGTTGTNRILYLGSLPAGSNPAGSPNPTFSGQKLTITASTDAPETGRSYTAYDGNPGTKWYSPPTSPLTAQLRFDLGPGFTITGVKWKFDYTGFADEFTVRLFNPGGASRIYGPFGNATQANAFFGQLMSEEQPYRYIEFFFENPRNIASIGSVSEVEIWGRLPTAKPPGSLNPSFSGQKLTITSSSDDQATGRSGYAHDANPTSKWYTNPTSPVTALLRFDLGADREISGIKWKFDYPGYADEFTVRIVHSNGASRTYGPFGNATQANTFFGQTMEFYTVVRYVEFNFANPRSHASIGSVSEVEIWGVPPPPNPPGSLNPAFSGQKLVIAGSSDTPASGRSGYTHDNNPTSKWYTNAPTPATTLLKFDLGADREISGIRWKFDYTGYADEFTVRIVHSSGASRTYGPFGNATQANMFFGQAMDRYTVISYVEFTFSNPRNLSSIGSVSEVEIWGLPAPVYPPGTQNPLFTGVSLPIAGSSDSQNTGRSGYAHDGNPTSKWYTNATTPATAQLRFDLGADVEITGVQWKFDYVGYADEFTVRIVNASGGSRTYGPFGNATQANVFFGQVEANYTVIRYVEFNFANPRSQASIGSISEVEIWGPGTGFSAAVEASPEASPDAETPVPVETEVPAGTPEPVATEAPTEPAASPAPATEEPTETVAPAGTSEPTVEPTAAISVGTITGTGGDAVNCRISAPEGDPITQLNEGDAVAVTGPAVDGWLPVMCNGEAGFIAEEFVSLGDVTPTESVEATATTEGEASPTEQATTEPTATEEPEETPYPIADTGDTENSGSAWSASDDDASTSWSVYPSQSPEQARLYVDLGSVLPIDRITLELATWDQLPTFEIWLSEDGETWYNSTPDGINGWNLDRDVPLEIGLGYDARYIRIVIPNVDEQLGEGVEVGGIRQLDVWAGDINETQYLTSLGDPTTPTPEPVQPTEEVIPTEIPTEEDVIEQPTEEVVEEPTVGDVPTEEVTEPTVEDEAPTEEPVG